MSKIARFSLAARFFQSLVPLVAGVSVGACSLHEASDEAPRPCVVDANESAAPIDLGSFQDDSNAVGPDEAGKERTLDASLHDGADTDAYTGTLLDRGFSGDPKVVVIVSEGFVATGRVRCSTGTTQLFSCGPATLDAADPNDRHCVSTAGDTPQFTLQYACDGTSTEDARLDVVVTRSAPGDACAPYTLKIFVD